MLSKHRIILNEYVDAVKDELGDAFSQAILYGSFARGDNNESSDIDLMILTTLSDEEIEQIKGNLYDLAFDIEIETGIIINPVIKNRLHFMYWVDTVPYYRNVKKEGIVLAG